MAIDFILPSRTAILKATKADAAFGTLIPKAQQYPHTVPATPAWPFSRFASMVTSPFRASGLDSSAFRITLQCFSKGVTTNGVLMLPAEDHVINCGSALKDALDGKVLPLTIAPYKIRLEWVQSLPMMDGDEAGAWMNSVIFNGDISA